LTSLPERLRTGARAVALAAAVGCAAGATAVCATPARGPDTVFLELLTWTEVRDLVRAGTTTIIIPAGGTEQSGPCIALGKHNRRVSILSERIARTLRNALVAPVVAYVPEGAIEPAQAHMRFPGTITVPPEVFEKTLESAAESFRAHGFTDVVLLGDHGSYQSDLAAVAARLNRRWAPTSARAHFIAEYYRSGDGHADLDDTALMLATDPALVRTACLHSATKLDASTGVYGADPRAASAERGRAAADAQVAAAVRAIRRATAPSRRPRS
jgi:creatinine amidohydrolase